MKQAKTIKSGRPASVVRSAKTAKYVRPTIFKGMKFTVASNSKTESPSE